MEHLRAMPLHTLTLKELLDGMGLDLTKPMSAIVILAQSPATSATSTGAEAAAAAEAQAASLAGDTARTEAAAVSREGGYANSDERLKAIGGMVASEEFPTRGALAGALGVSVGRLDQLRLAAIKRGFITKEQWAEHFRRAASATRAQPASFASTGTSCASRPLHVENLLAVAARAKAAAHAANLAGDQAAARAAADERLRVVVELVASEEFPTRGALAGALGVDDRWFSELRSRAIKRGLITEEQWAEHFRRAKVKASTASASQSLREPSGDLRAKPS